jgi:uncharacterized membrane protein
VFQIASVFLLDRKDTDMKTVQRITAALTLSLLAGCMTTGPSGGEPGANQGFKISVPAMDTEIKQGNTQTITVSLQRGDYFKQNVAVLIKSTAGITVTPDSLMVKASDGPDIQVQVTAAKDAALGEYGVFVTGTPPMGEPTSADFKLKVVGQ